MAIYLVRHGETASNAARVVQLPEVPLSERGREQAACIARRLAAAGVTRILASDLRRAAETAEEIAAQTGVPVEPEPLLRERDFGDVRGTPYAELGFDLFAPDFAPPRGETWEAFRQRVDAAWERVRRAAAETQGHLVAVTHGLVCRSIAERHLELPRGSTVPVAWANTALTIVERDPPFAVSLLHCIAHLDEKAAAASPGSIA